MVQNFVIFADRSAIANMKNKIFNGWVEKMMTLLLTNVLMCCVGERSIEQLIQSC